MYRRHCAPRTSTPLWMYTGFHAKPRQRVSPFRFSGLLTLCLLTAILRRSALSKLESHLNGLHRHPTFTLGKPVFNVSGQHLQELLAKSQHSLSDYQSSRFSMALGAKPALVHRGCGEHHRARWEEASPCGNFPHDFSNVRAWQLLSPHLQPL
jgi:hypothetical protein